MILGESVGLDISAGLGATELMKLEEIVRQEIAPIVTMIEHNTERWWRHVRVTNC